MAFWKVLVGIGVCFIVAGLIWAVVGKHLPLGKLPGDIAVERPGFKFYFPIGTSILVSVLISLILYLVRKFT